ncbi:MAG: hypothetical protein DRJ47_05440 [Thermoprotei archaeon]|nr:MAG: hypothetical protein DRJ47_05440 [Thermoprotei archaeon]
MSLLWVFNDPILAIIYLILFPGFIFILILSLIFEWYKRKVIARMHSRMGPTYTGNRGMLQPFADFIKLLFKEDIRVQEADHPVIDLTLLLAPAIMITLIAIFIPWFGTPFYSFTGDVIIIYMLFSLVSTLIFLVGWSVKSPFTRIGALRLLLQVAGFDIASLLLLAVPIAETGSLSIASIAGQMPYILLQKPLYLIPHAIAFILFIVSQQAEMEEDPFDIPHAETEIVAGHVTEISGRRLAFLNFFRDLQLLFVGVFTGSIFIGVPFQGIQTPFTWIGNLLILLIEAALILFILFVIEAAAARIRISDLLEFFWHNVIPISMVIISLTLIIKGIVG